MNNLKIEYKYNVGQIVYFMYKNEIRKGIITAIHINIESKQLATYLTKKIIDKLITIFDEDYPFKKILVKYSLDLVSKSGDFESSIPFHHECDLYETKKDLINDLIHILS